MNPLPVDANFNPVPVFNPGNKSPIKVLAGSVSDVLDAKKNTIVRLYSDDDCNVAFGKTPVADDDSIPLPGGQYADYTCLAGFKIAAHKADLFIMVHQE